MFFTPTFLSISYTSALRFLSFSSSHFIHFFSFFFFNDTATTEIYTLSLHDALPIYHVHLVHEHHDVGHVHLLGQQDVLPGLRSEEHTSELQSQSNLVCRLLLEKKKNNRIRRRTHNTTIHCQHLTTLTA